MYQAGVKRWSGWVVNIETLVEEVFRSITEVLIPHYENTGVESN